jgi:CheY-like chemotaxis protein
MMRTPAPKDAGDIFVVDDNPNNLGLLTNILRQAGFSVRVAQSGKRALAAIAAQAPELVLLDVSMPDMDGYAVCSALRADPLTNDIPVIFLSALNDVADKVAAFDSGGQDYVTKPFQAAEVLVRVRTQLGLSRARRELERSNLELERKNRELTAAWADADRLFAAFSNVLEGTVLDEKFALERKIGVGGTAAVYRATHLASGRAVAVKIMRPHPGTGDSQARRTITEGKSALLLDHPNAVKVLASGTTPAGISYLVMELYTGDSFEAEVARAPVSVARALEVVVPVCSVLAAAHEIGIIHRDIKPANVFLHRGPDGAEVVKVVDFGIAKLDFDEGALAGTTMGRLLGTPLYMAPERLLGKPYDGRVDVYSVGMMLFRALTGTFPFPISDALGAMIMTCVHQPPARLSTLRPGVPGRLDELVARMLAKSPAERPAMSELATLLAEAAADADPRSVPPVGPTPDLAETVDAPLNVTKRE